MPSNFYDVKPAILNPQPANTDLSNISSSGKAYVAIKGYDSTATYSLNEVVLTVSNNEVKLYQSLANNNTSSLSDTTKWKEVSLGANIDLSNLSNTGEAHFANPDLSNLSSTGEAKLKSNVQLVNEAPAQPETGVLYVIPES